MAATTPAPAPTPTPAIPITIVTGFLGAGKTTVILQLVPQLRAANPHYRLALLKNELGEVAIDSRLAGTGPSAVSAVRELLGGCLCCHLVGGLAEALAELAGDAGGRPDRIVIETSGSAFPATLALEVNRVARASGGAFVLDGVVSVIDVENWRGYADTSYTAVLQARYTDLIVFNKWELCPADRLDYCRDRVGDLGTDVACIQSRRGWVPADAVFGLDAALAGHSVTAVECAVAAEQDAATAHSDHDHQSEVDVLAVELRGPSTSAATVAKLEALLRLAPRDEVYRIKGIVTVSGRPHGSESDGVSLSADDDDAVHRSGSSAQYILNWAFGRWTFTRLHDKDPDVGGEASLVRLTVVLANGEASRWKTKLETSGWLCLPDGGGRLTVDRLA